MSHALNITLIQSALYWQNSQANLDHFTSLIEGMNDATDLIMLPEMFTTGFSMKPGEFAEDPNGTAVQWMMQMAAKRNCAITGSLMVKENGQYFNRLFFVTPDQQIRTYNKRHLFRMAGENQHYTPGNDKLLIGYKGFKIFPIICYDLRFPVWIRRTKDFNYDLLLVVANWPERRNTHWKTLLQARAIENQTWVAAVNRIGEDEGKVNHSGDSALINAKGEIVFQQADTPFIRTFSINKDETNTYREAFNVIDDADSFKLL